MKYPSEFYQLTSKSQLSYTRAPTGIIDVQRLIQAKAPWILPSTRVLQPKKLIFADWTAINWFFDKLNAVQSALLELIDEGFSLYLFQDIAGHLNLLPLSRESINSLTEVELRYKVTACFPSVLINMAIKQLRVSRDELLILDDYQVNRLLSKEMPSSTRLLHLRDYERLVDIDHLFLRCLEVNPHPISHLVKDSFSSNHNKLFKTLRQEFPEAEIIQAIECLKLKPSQLNHLLVERSITHSDYRFNFEQLNDIKLLDLDNTKLRFADLNCLLQASPKLQFLNLTCSSIAEGSLVLQPESLPSLVFFCLNASNIKTQDLQTLIKASPKVLFIHLDECKEITENLELEPRSLLALEELHLSGSKINTASLRAFFTAAPNIKRVALVYCVDIGQNLHLEAQSLSLLEELNLGEASLTDEGIQNFLQATNRLKVLSLSGCIYLKEGHPRLAAQSLPFLKKLDLSNSTISAENLYNLLAAAPNIVELNLFNSMKSNEILTLLPKSLPALCEINLPHDLARQPGMIERLLIAAPNIKKLNILAPFVSLSAEYTQRLLALKHQIDITYNFIPIDRILFTTRRGVSLASSSASHEQTEIPLIDPQHQPSALRNYNPNNSKVRFQFTGGNRYKNQGMIIEKLCQYLTLKQQYTVLIPSLQKGICSALSYYFKDARSAEWEQFIQCISLWDGQANSLDDELTYYFEHLWGYIQKYQSEYTLDLSLSSLQHNLNKASYQLTAFLSNPIDSLTLTAKPYIGDQLALFLTRINRSCILSNPWHSIAITPLSQGHWQVYDPNFIDGAKLVPEADLVRTIVEAIGSIIATDWLGMEFNPGIGSPELFLEQGGLLALCEYSNGHELIAQIPLNFNFSAAALDGLLIRNLSGVPAWVVALRTSSVHSLANQLLGQFIEKNPNSFQQALQHSIALLSSADKRKYINHIKALAPVKHSPAIPALAQASLLQFIGKTVRVNSYERSLETWNKSCPTTRSPNDYCHDLLQTERIRNRLVELNSSLDLKGLRFALESYAQGIRRPLFYIHSSEDLIDASAYIERQGNLGIIKKGLGGPLHDFLRANQSDQAPILLINYEQFTAEELVRFNTLFDRKRDTARNLIGENTLVIGLSNKNKPDCYQGSDFYSSFDLVEQCPLSKEQLQEAIPQLPIIEKSESNSTNLTTINLFHAKDWKERLLGRWILDGASLYFEEGGLAEIPGNKLELQNAPWEDEDFQLFWQQAFLRGEVSQEGHRLALPTDLQLIVNQGYDWESLRSVIHFINTESNSASSAHVEFLALNATILTEFFRRYDYSESERSLIRQPGFIALNQGKTLCIQLTSALTEHEWADLLTECQKFQVILHVNNAPGVKLPPELALIAPEKPTLQRKLWNQRHSLVTSTEIIVSTDIDTTVSLLTQQGDWQVIDISECKAADLLLRLDGKLNPDTLRFEFQQKSAALLHGLAKNKRIILKGNFSKELADQLAPLLLTRQNSQSVQGQLLLISEDKASFPYLPTTLHEVDEQSKLHCLGELTMGLEQKLSPFLAQDPLSKLIARRDFWQTTTEQINSEETWAGIRQLPEKKYELAELNPTDIEAQIESHRTQRREALDKRLQRAPYVFVAGLSGVGKSTFITEDYAREGDRLYLGEGQNKVWAKDRHGTGRKLLVIDEATLSSRDWTEFKGLFQNPPGILINGKFYPLSPEHKVIFIGNPVSYGDERKMASLFEHHGNSIIFEPLPVAILYESILKPVYSNTRLEIRAAELSHHFLEVYRFLVDCSTTDVLISPRELQMMALLTAHYCKQNELADPQQVACHYAYLIAKNLVPQHKKTEFEQQFKPIHAQTRQEPLINNPNFLLTSSRLPHHYLLEDLLTRQQSCQEEQNNDVQRYGGLGGLIVEGEPGTGKIEFILNELHLQGYEEVLDLQQPTSQTKIFYRLTAQLSLTEREMLLRKAFDEGAIVLIDKINSSPMMERLLNSLLMGRTPEGRRPLRPGFMVIGTQNPHTMAGRRSTSTALSRRLITIELPPYPKEEMQAILINRGLKKEQSEQLLEAYNNKLRQAKTNNLSPAPNFHNLLRLAENLIKENRVAADVSPSGLMEQTDTSQETKVLNILQPLVKKAYSHYKQNQNAVNQGTFGSITNCFFRRHRQPSNELMQARSLKQQIVNANSATEAIDTLKQFLGDGNTDYNFQSLASLIKEELDSGPSP